MVYNGPLTVSALVAEAHGTALDKGWWECQAGHERGIPEQIALMHSELSEALEEFRSGHPLLESSSSSAGKPEGFGVELADCIIRIADTCGRYGIDLEKCLKDKLAYNHSRPHRHGGKKA